MFLALIIATQPRRKNLLKFFPSVSPQFTFEFGEFTNGAFPTNTEHCFNQTTLYLCALDV